MPGAERELGQGGRHTIALATLERIIDAVPRLGVGLGALAAMVWTTRADCWRTGTPEGNVKSGDEHAVLWTLTPVTMLTKRPGSAQP